MVCIYIAIITVCTVCVCTDNTVYLAIVTVHTVYVLITLCT